MHTFGMGGMWLWWLLPLLIVAAALYIVYERSSGSRSRALDILDERLAKGEIDEKTYEKLKEELTNKR
jgi:putative membrane protein